MGLFSRKRPPAPSTGESSGISGRGPAWSGRELYLPFPLTAEHAPQHAAWLVETVGPSSGFDLDYSVASLDGIDRMLGDFEKEGSDGTAEIVIACGTYVGEVLVRTHGYRWVDLDDSVAQMFGFRIAALSPTGAYANPVGKAFKRVELGEADSVVFFVQAELAGEARRQAE